MMGTLSTLLARDKISTSEDRYHADVEGDIETPVVFLKSPRFALSII